MSENEIKKAAELLKLETSAQELSAEIERLQSALQRFEEMITMLTVNPDHYFEIKTKISEMFPDDNFETF